MKRQIHYIILYGLVILLLFLLVNSVKHNSMELPTPIIDTFYKIDTLRYPYPVTKDSTIIDTFFFPIIIDKDSLLNTSSKDSLLNDSIKKDTIYAKLPIEEKVYEDSTYYVRISGFQPRLEEVIVYPKETIIYKTEFVREQKNWFENHLYYGVGVGLGYGIFHRNVDIFIGGTVGFRF